MTGFSKHRVFLSLIVGEPVARFVWLPLNMGYPIAAAPVSLSLVDDFRTNAHGHKGAVGKRCFTLLRRCRVDITGTGVNSWIVACPAVCDY